MFDVLSMDISGVQKDYVFNEWIKEANEFLCYQPWENALVEPNLKICTSYAEYDKKMGAFLALQALKAKAARMPVIGSPAKHALEMKKLGSYAFAKGVMRDTLGHLVTYNVYTKNDKMMLLQKKLGPEEAQLFDMDMSK